jgi:hypothetical protein
MYSNSCYIRHLTITTSYSLGKALLAALRTSHLNILLHIDHYCSKQSKNLKTKGLRMSYNLLCYIQGETQKF